jgi:hypothetical protein
MVSISSILSHTPVWVWALFAFLVLSGLSALRPRKSRPVTMLLLPVFFFVWGLYSVFMELPRWTIALGVFAVMIAIGFRIGWLLASRYPASTYDREARRVMRPGTPLTLIFIMIGFVAKYVLSVVMAINPVLSGTIGFALVYGTTSGLISGAFWGIMGLQLLQAFDYRGQGNRPME